MDDIIKIIKTRKILQNKHYCVLTSRLVASNKAKIFLVRSQNELFTKMYESLSECDAYILQPDSLTLGYFTQRTLVKELLLHNKIIIGFDPSQKVIGIHITYSVSTIDYLKNVISFIKKIDPSKKPTHKKVIRPKHDSVIIDLY